MEILIYLFLLFIGFLILYLVIKAAVRNGILEAGLGHESERQPGETRRITLIPCPQCDRTHDPELEACPHCGHSYQ